MGREQVRILGLAAAAIALLVVTSVAMDWFTCDQGAVKITFSLKGMHACTAGHCEAFGLPKEAGMYKSSAPGTLWGSLAYAAFVGFIACASVFAGVSSPKFTKGGYAIGMMSLGTSFFTGYILVPDAIGSNAVEPAFQTAVVISRTWAPILQVLGHALGIAAVYYAANPQGGGDGSVGEYKPIVLDKVAKPEMASPALAKGRVRLAVETAEVSRAGLDARLEDGSSVKIAWRDLDSVGASRLPARQPYGGAVFVELVSTTGETVRVLPWTRLTGEQIPGENEVRARGILRFASAQNAAARIDAGTRGFLSGKEPAAYDPD